MAPGDFQAGCQILADGFIAELRQESADREAAHQKRMAAMTPTLSSSYQR